MKTPAHLRSMAAWSREAPVSSGCIAVPTSKWVGIHAHEAEAIADALEACAEALTAACLAEHDQSVIGPAVAKAREALGKLP